MQLSKLHSRYSDSVVLGEHLNATCPALIRTSSNSTSIGICISGTRLLSCTQSWWDCPRLHCETSQVCNREAQAGREQEMTSPDTAQEPQPLDSGRALGLGLSKTGAFLFSFDSVSLPHISNRSLFYKSQLKVYFFLLQRKNSI